LSKKSNLLEEPVVDWKTACFFFKCAGHVISNEAVSVNCELERRGGKDSFAFICNTVRKSTRNHNQDQALWNTDH